MTCTNKTWQTKKSVMHLNIHSVALLTHRAHFTHKPLPQRMRHVQLLRGIRRQLTQMGNIVLKSFTQTPLWSVNLGSVCFCESPSVWLILAVWQQCFYYDTAPLKACFHSFPALLFAFEGSQSSFTEGFQSLFTGNLLNTKEWCQW